MIVGVALRHKTNGRLWTLPKPYRHHHLFKLTHADGVNHWEVEQGFIDSDGVYKNRIDAKIIAIENNQLIEGHSLLPQLFSECLW